jgi:hypothetical protein
MTLTATKRPKTVAGDDMAAEALFPEARARRRRLRAFFAASAVVIAAAVIAVGGFGLSGGRTGQSPGSAGSSLASPSPGHITSVTFTETRQIEGSRPLQLLDGTALIKMVVTTTLTPRDPTGMSWDYDEAPSKGHSVLSLQSRNIVEDGRVFTSDPGRKQICYRSAAGRTTCATTTKPWLERSVPQSLNGKAIQRISISYDPSYLFEDLRSTARGLIRVGGTKITGVAVTEYRGQIPAQRPGPSLSTPAAERPVLEFAVPSRGDFYSGGQVSFSDSPRVQFTSVPVEVWVDSKGVVRQVRVTEPSLVSSADRDLIEPLVVTLDYSNFNQPVRPPKLSSQDVFVVPGDTVSESITAGS